MDAKKAGNQSTAVFSFTHVGGKGPGTGKKRHLHVVRQSPRSATIDTFLENVYNRPVRKILGRLG